ncbi:2Fe-2S iron-sulfur cluster binding domain-containing protein, partial [bacterium]|nr:2Fe-2S iron-sulfur cluster binding domain-containing protein [bacterium]
VGSPQIRNRGTIAGNVITASPANDTISPLMALDASVSLLSKRGTRTVPLNAFYKGVRKTVIAADEVLVDISFKGLEANQRGVYKKSALRRAQAISLVNLAIILTFDGDLVTKASITLGAVAPTIIHARRAEQFLIGNTLSESVIAGVASLAASEIAPISDIRSSAGYRVGMAETMIKRGLAEIQMGTNGASLPKHPVLLWGKQTVHSSPVINSGKAYTGTEPIQARVNGKQLTLTGGYKKTLLRWIREEALLIGTKEGCAEGECGACTVFLDGKAVMSCLVAAPRADKAELITIEGLGSEGHLSAVQQAFVDEGAVQCGYCTPGFVMASEKLLEENGSPSVDDIKVAISGNLCRCTGYYKIVKAVEKAASNQ